MSFLWSRFFRRTTISSLDALPEEILIDHVLALLTVKEILMVRRVSEGLSLEQTPSQLPSF